MDQVAQNFSAAGLKKHYSLGDEARTFYARLPNGVEVETNLLVKQRHAFKNQVDVLKLEWQVKNYGCLKSASLHLTMGKNP